MDHDREIGFLEQYAVSCCRPSRYNILMKGKKGSFVAYLLFLSLLLFILQYGIPFLAWDCSVGGLKNLFLKHMPAFQVENGAMTIDSPIDMELGGAIHIYVDSSVDTYDVSELDGSYVMEVMAGRTGILYQNNNRVAQLEISDLGNVAFSNSTLAAHVPLFRLLLGIYLVLFYLLILIRYCFIAMIFALILRSSVRNEAGDCVTFEQAFCIAVYARTLFAILSAVNGCLGNPAGSMFVTAVSVAGSMIFMIRGEASVLGIDFQWKNRKQ